MISTEAGLRWPESALRPLLSRLSALADSSSVERSKPSMFPDCCVSAKNAILNNSSSMFIEPAGAACRKRVALSGTAAARRRRQS